MNIVLLDDNATHNKLLRMNLEQLMQQYAIPGQVVLEATDFQQVLGYAAGDPPMTIYFMDILLEQELNGIETIMRLRRRCIKDQFIIVSAYPHYALESLKVHAYDFLVKPVEHAALETCFLSLCQELQSAVGDMIDINIGARTIRIPISEIYYIEAVGRNVCAHTGRGIYSWAESLANMEERLKPYAFVRIHRKYLANSTYIDEWNDSEHILIVHGEKLLISRRKLSLLTRGNHHE